LVQEKEIVAGFVYDGSDPEMIVGKAGSSKNGGEEAASSPVVNADSAKVVSGDWRW